MNFYKCVLKSKDILKPHLRNSLWLKYTARTQG